ncbi:MAG: hypothetical protein RL562_1202, partial [Planctomycetota bacterium]
MATCRLLAGAVMGCWLASALPAQVLPTLPPDTRTPGVWEPREFVIPTFASA